MKFLDLVTLRDPKSPIAEVYKTLRTNIKFKSFDKSMKTVVITSTGPSEGKSTIVSNLGVTMAQVGNKVVILDGDLRNASIHKNFHLSNTIGLTNILAEDTPFKNVVMSSGTVNLDIISSGPIPPNPAELLNSERMKNLLDTLKKTYDYVLIDTPPAVLVTDAALLASVADGTLLVVSSGDAIIEGAIKAKELLKNVGANILGVVLNKVKVNRSSAYYKYYPRYYGNENRVKSGRTDRAKKETVHA